MTVTAEIADPGSDVLSRSIAREIIETLRSFRNFALVGIVATIVHYLVLILLISGNVIQSLVVANMLGFCSAIFVSYAGNRFFVFDGKHGHLSGFIALAAGALTAAGIHTGLLVGLTEGQVFTFLGGPMSALGGQVLIDLWRGVLAVLPEFVAQNLVGQTPLSMSTTAAFFIASGVAAVLTYCWNRFVVFQSKCTKTVQP